MKTRLAFASILALLIAPASANAAIDVATTSDASQVSAEDYWTKERMESAIPLGVPEVTTGTAAGDPSSAEPARAGNNGIATLVKNPGGKTNRAHGRVFFVRGGKNYTCSGTVVQSKNRSTVWTAGHCVRGGGRKGKFNSRFVFVPAYNEGKSPYGKWAAKKLFSATQWSKKRDFSFDIGAAQVRVHKGGKRIGGVTGGRDISFNKKPPRRITAYGYPAETNTATNQNFRGNREWRCATRKQGRLRVGQGKPAIKIGCSMTGGASGGGWITPSGKLIAASSFVRDRSGNRSLYASYLGSTAKKLWQRASGRRR